MSVDVNTPEERAGARLMCAKLNQLYQEWRSERRTPESADIASSDSSALRSVREPSKTH